MGTGLSRVQRHALDEAKERGYLVAHGFRVRLMDAWYHWCADHGQPCVYVNAGRTYGSVSLDLDTVDRRTVYDLTEEALARQRAFALPLMARGRRSFACFGGWPLVGGLRLEDAHELAWFFLAEARDPANRRRRYPHDPADSLMHAAARTMTEEEEG